MIKIRTLTVSGFIGAIEGMRKPFKNNYESDSGPAIVVLDKLDLDDPYVEACHYWDEEFGLNIMIGKKDMELCQKLLRTNKDDHSKFMRMIHVQANVNAPLYWWKEYDTYKVGTVANSESTMHTIHKQEFSVRDFSHDQLLDSYTIGDEFDDETYSKPEDVLMDTMMTLNELRSLYLQAKKDGKEVEAKDYWYNMIQLLPTSYMQERTIDLNYQTLRRIYFARKGHKLTEWAEFIEWISELPYAEQLIMYKDKVPAKREGYLTEASNLVADMVLNGCMEEELKEVIQYVCSVINSRKSGNDLDMLREAYRVAYFKEKYGGLSYS